VIAAIDVHAHYGKWPFPVHNVSLSDMVSTMRIHGIVRAVVSSTLAILYDFREGNRTLAEAIALYPELLGYVTVNLSYPDDSIQELETYLRSSKFIGVKIHQNYSRQKVNSPSGERIMRAISAYGCPVLLHTYSSPLESPWNAVPVAKAYPNVPIILAHMGGDTWWEGIRAAKEAQNLYVDPSATWADADKVAAAVHELGSEHILF